MGVSAAWDRFWSYDRLASFGTGTGAGNYDEPIAAAWRSFFSSLPPRSRVLDLCTGNGAIAVMAVEAGADLQVSGADLASVQPAAFVSSGGNALQRIRFLPNTPAEALPFADGSFDAVTSQYGIEYSDMEQSVAEAARMLAPGGRLRLACHAAEGTVVAATRGAVADADFLLDELDLAGRASAGFTAVLDIERGRSSGPLAQAVAQTKYAAFREGLAAVADRARTAADSAMLCCVHGSLTDLFQQRQTLDEGTLIGKIGHLRDEVDAHRTREQALLAAAMSRDAMAALGKTLTSLGLGDIEHGEQCDGADLIGHVVTARRP